MWRIRNFWSNLTSSSCPEPSQTSTRWTNIGMTKSTKFLIWMISRADWELFLPKWNVRGMFNAPLLSEPNIVEYILYLQLTIFAYFSISYKLGSISLKFCAQNEDVPEDIFAPFSFINKPMLNFTITHWGLAIGPLFT